MRRGEREGGCRPDGSGHPARRALAASFPKTLPVMGGYVFLGITYGVLMVQSGFPAWLPSLTALIIYTGSMEFLMVEILASSFNPLSAFATAFMVGSRHLFYGIAMLDRYRGTGWKKPYLIFTTSDETFAVNYSAEIPAGVDRGWFYLWVSLLDQVYWVAGSTLGACLGSAIPFDTEGLGFVMTAMFAVIFLDQWRKDTDSARALGTYGPLRSHLCELVGIGASVACLAVFGPDHFIVPSMVVMLAILTAFRGSISRTLPGLAGEGDAPSPEASAGGEAPEEGAREERPRAGELGAEDRPDESVGVRGRWSR